VAVMRKKGWQNMPRLDSSVNLRRHFGEVEVWIHARYKRRGAVGNKHKWYSEIIATNFYAEIDHQPSLRAALDWVNLQLVTRKLTL
jgi:hypothetical protein